MPESSGGPLVNADGELVGMAMATTAASGEQGALAIPWATVQQRLGELEVDKRQIYVGWRVLLPLRAAAARVRAA